MSDFTIDRCSFRAIFMDENAAELFAEYAAECSLPELGAIEPHERLYESMQVNGSLHCWAVRKEGQLVGFAAVLTSILPHYSRKTAIIESIFVSKAERKSGVGAELLSAIEDFAKESRCAAMLYSAPVGSQFEKLLKLKYRKSNTVYIQKL